MPQCDFNPQMPYAERCSAHATMRLEYIIVEDERVSLGSAKMCERHARSEAEFIAALPVEAIAYISPLLS